MSTRNPFDPDGHDSDDPDLNDTDLEIDPQQCDEISDYEREIETFFLDTPDDDSGVIHVWIVNDDDDDEDPQDPQDNLLRDVIGLFVRACSKLFNDE